MVITFGLDTKFEAFIDQFLVGSVTVSSLTQGGQVGIFILRDLEMLSTCVISSFSVVVVVGPS